MSVFYTARKGFKRGEKSIESAMNKAMDKDVICVNQKKIDIKDTVMVKAGVTIEGDLGKPRPVIVPSDRKPAFMVGANESGTVTLRHLSIQLGDSSLGLRSNSKRVKIVLDDVHIYHNSKVMTPYNALVIDAAGQSDVDLENTVLDSVQMDVNSIRASNSNIGDWYIENSQIRLSQGNFDKTALQNILVFGHDGAAQIQLRQCVIGGNVRFDQVQGAAVNLDLTQLPVINHTSKHGNAAGDATSLIIGPNTKFTAKHVKQVDPRDQVLNSKLDLPKWRALGIIGGSLTVEDAYFRNGSLKNVAQSGDLTFENVSDDSQWSVSKDITLSNRNSQSQLFDQQSQLNITGDENKSMETQQSALEKLDEMIGLTGVKERLHQIISQAQLNAERKKRGMENSENQLSLNLVFAGSPGTGKTVVARLVGQALYEAGVLKSTTFIEARGADLVGEHVGETQPKTRDLVRTALDGVLFIDEAYSLAPPKNGGNSFNNEAVAELIADMENYSDRLVVIMAGYTQEMADFFRRGNPGLASRINNWIEFPDYTVPELKEIAKLDIKHAHARFASKSAVENLYNGLQELVPLVSKSHTAGNGRFVRNYVQKVTEMRDARLAQQDTSGLSNEQLLIIEPQDSLNAVRAMQKQISDMQQ